MRKAIDIIREYRHGLSIYNYFASAAQRKPRSTKVDRGSR